MNHLFKLCVMTYWLALIAWCAALIAAAIAAMNVFGTLNEIAVSWSDYEAYPAEHHSRIVAGHIMEGVFLLVDIMQFIAVPLVMIMLLLQLTAFKQPWRRASNLLRSVCLIIASALFVYHVLAIAPSMNGELRRYWSAASSGDVARAESHLQAFNRLHPKADAILRLDLLLVLVAAGASAVALSQSPATQASTGLKTASLARSTP